MATQTICQLACLSRVNYEILIHASVFALSTDMFGSEKIAQIMANVDELLHRYDIDASVCGRRLVCSMVQNAAQKVARGHGSSTDKLVDGLSGYVVT